MGVQKLSKEKKQNETLKKLIQIEKKLNEQNILLTFLINPKKEDDKVKSEEQIWELHKLGVSNEIISLLLDVSVKTVTNRVGEKKKK